MPNRQYNIFISHSWSYGDAYDRLRDLLDAAPYFSYRDYSIPKDDPIHTRGSDRVLREAISQKMMSCHIVLVMAGKYATFSEWIEKEVQIAQGAFSSPKPILAIRPWANTQVSRFVEEESEQLVNWNTNSIVTAIRELAL